MGIVAIYCPRTGREVSTGVETDRDGFAKLRPIVQRMKCQACGSEHVWSKATARFVETPVAAVIPTRRPPPARAGPGRVMRKPLAPPVSTSAAAPSVNPALPPPTAAGAPAPRRGRTLSIASRFLDRQ